METKQKQEKNGGEEVKYTFEDLASVRLKLAKIVGQLETLELRHSSVMYHVYQALDQIGVLEKTLDDERGDE